MSILPCLSLFVTWNKSWVVSRCILKTLNHLLFHLRDCLVVISKLKERILSIEIFSINPEVSEFVILLALVQMFLLALILRSHLTELEHRVNS